MSTNTKTAVITGAGSGLGYAIAEAFVQQGTNVVLNGRDENKLTRAAAQLGQPSQLVIVAGDGISSGVAFLAEARDSSGAALATGETILDFSRKKGRSIRLLAVCRPEQERAVCALEDDATGECRSGVCVERIGDFCQADLDCETDDPCFVAQGSSIQR